MRVLITWGTQRGGTEGIARIIGEQLERDGFDTVLLPARKALQADRYDAVIVGGAVYANRWHRDARRFVQRNVAVLRRVPVWLFSSGPLDDSASRGDIRATRQVHALAERIGAVGHATFGGRLAPDAKGFPAAAMARQHAGDWRDPERIRAWAAEVAHALPTARPRLAVDHAARSPLFVAGHAVIGWALCGAVMVGMLAIAPEWLALLVHAIAAPLVFAALAARYFAEPGAREPLPTALAFTGTVVFLDAAVVAGAIQHSFAMFASIAGTWLPFALIFTATWLTGAIMQMRPWPIAETAA